MAGKKPKVVSAAPDPDAAERMRKRRQTDKSEAAKVAALAIALADVPDMDDVWSLADELAESRLTMPGLQDLQTILMGRVNVQRGEDGSPLALGGPRIESPARRPSKGKAR